MKLSYLIIITLFTLFFVSCGNQWSSKEKSEFTHDCTGGDSDNEKKIAECECIFEVISSGFSYEEAKALEDAFDALYSDSSKPQDAEESLNSENLQTNETLADLRFKLEKKTRKIKRCYK